MKYFELKEQIQEKLNIYAHARLYILSVENIVPILKGKSFLEQNEIDQCMLEIVALFATNEDLFGKIDDQEYFLFHPMGREEKNYELSDIFNSKKWNEVGKKYYIEFSVGALNYPEDVEDASRLLDKTYKVLYDAQLSGKQYCIGNQQDKSNRDTLEELFSRLSAYYKLSQICILEYQEKKKQGVVWKKWEYNETENTFREGAIDWEWFDEYCQTHKYWISAEGALVFPVYESLHLVGAVVYTRESNEDWKKDDIQIMLGVKNLIVNYTLKERMQQQLEKEVLYTGCAMETEHLTYYVVEEDSHEIVYVSRYASDMLPNIEEGKKCYESVWGYEKPCLNCPVYDLKKGKAKCSTEMYDAATDSWKRITAARIPMPSGKCQYLVCLSDITAFWNRVHSTEALTGTLSYEKFRSEVIKRLADKKLPMTIVYLGIQHFGSVNEQYGFSAGDTLLKTFARNAMKVLTEEELVCRIKGDDFIFLLYENDKERIQKRISLICKKTKSMVKNEMPNLYTLPVGGAYEIKESDASINQIMDRVSWAKRTAMDSYVKHSTIFYVTDEYDKIQMRNREMKRDMVHALENNEYVVYMQPKVSLDTHTIKGAEALVRWKKPDGTLVPPGDFIPIAEKNGFIAEIDRYVFESVVRTMNEWKKEGKELPIISVNASKNYLFQEEFVDYMRELTKKYEIPCSLIEIEITESVFFGSVERMTEIIEKLHALGFLISMDDFGTGYSTLNLMKTLSIDILKIDGEFFKRNKMDEKNKAVISAIIHLAKNLGLKVVAEGIETKEQLDYIEQENCDYAQGYYYYKPMPVDEFKELL